jgi:hypothetical protein
MNLLQPKGLPLLASYPTLRSAWKLLLPALLIGAMAWKLDEPHRSRGGPPTLTNNASFSGMGLEKMRDAWSFGIEERPSGAWDRATMVARARDLALTPLDAPIRRAPSPLPDFLGSIDGARFDLDTGQAMTAALDRRIEELEALYGDQNFEEYGISLLTLDEVFGTMEANFEDALCEPLEILWEFEDDVSGSSRDYEGKIWVFPWESFVTDISPVLVQLPSICANSLASNAGDVDAAVAGACNEDDEATFFPVDSTCRACLESSAGDFDLCVDHGECMDEAQWVTAFYYETEEPALLEVWTSFLAACAPDYILFTYLLTIPDDDEEMPDTFDHDAWIHECVPMWSNALNDFDFLCVGAAPKEDHLEVLWDGVPFRTSYLRPEGTSGTPWWDRLGFASEIRFDNGMVMKYTWAGEMGSGVITGPAHYNDSNGDGIVDETDDIGSGEYAFGLNPTELRPDGTDPTELDHTKARDFVAAAITKASSRINGIPITCYNHNRCQEDAWEGPDAEGRYRCTALDRPTMGWMEDGWVYWGDDASASIYTLPMATIASTGLPDPDVPGGVVIHVAGSDILADPGYDDNPLPNRFVPDLIQLADHPEDWANEGGSLTGNTYRFGKDPDQDIRFVMHANHRRNFHPEAD